MIRDATANDAAAMARLMVDTWFHTHKDQVPKATYERRKLEWGYAESEHAWRRSIESSNDSNRVWVATLGTDVVGLAASRLSETGLAEVSVMYVDVPYQRTGAGSALLNAKVAHFRGLGSHSMQIAVLVDNPSARRFYERMGGVELTVRAGPDGDEVVYEWRLL